MAADYHTIHTGVLGGGITDASNEVYLPVWGFGWYYAVRNLTYLAFCC